jgi:pimeloyl-ACP methyl ester carboxylesterase
VSAAALARVRPIWLVALAVVLSACGDGGASADVSGSRAVSFESSDGVELDGRLFGEGSTGIVLAHMRPADQRSWYAFARRLADQGYLVLTFDFRGYCPGGDGGCSSGELEISELWRDVVAAADLVRTEGATNVALVGASMGGTASLVAAAAGGTDPEVVVTLSAPMSIEGLVVDPALLQQVSANKLFIAGVGDAAAADDADELYAISPPPKRIDIVPADDHGTDLLTGPRGEEVRRTIETYLAQFAPA